MFRRRFGFRRRAFSRRVGRIARNATGIILAKRIRISGLTIPDVSAADWDNPLQVSLAIASEAQDETLVADGTNIPTVPLYSKLLSLKLQLIVLGATSTTNVYRAMIHKLPDGEELVADATRMINAFHTSADDTEQREFRKMQMWKSMLVTNPNTAVVNTRAFIRRSAMRRVSPMREGDVIRLDIAKDTAGTTSILHGFGTMWFRANA